LQWTGFHPWISRCRERTVSTHPGPRAHRDAVPVLGRIVARFHRPHLSFRKDGSERGFYDCGKAPLCALAFPGGMCRERGKKGMGERGRSDRGSATEKLPRVLENSQDLAGRGWGNRESPGP